MNIYDKLQLARIKLQVMNLKKSGKNKYSGFTYYELADFIPAVNNIFGELKMSSVFGIKDSAALLTIINSENPEEKIEFTSPIAKVELKGCSEIQAIGAAHTYMRRYLYTNALEIVENDALDAVAGYPDIETIRDIAQLNKAFSMLHGTEDDGWKYKIKNKAKSLSAVFDKDANIFVENIG